MATQSNATVEAEATDTKAASKQAKALQAANLGSGKTGFKAVTLYNRRGDKRVVETVAEKVQAEFDGWSAVRPGK